ncbi:MAG TPA: NAD-dependent epimerase/dehydratase family protein [Planctomycetota bacterium]|nr:NAD-dependent epimerase/dehydratase family protein [Planctomycetota bacterium]
MTSRGRVLVTGGAGFLGHHLVRRLLAAGRPVTVLDDLSAGSVERLPRHDRLAVIAGSVLDPAALARAAAGAELVHHLAGVVGMAQVVRDGPRAFAVAAQGTAAVLAATGGAPAVLVSSSAVYGLGRSGAARECDPIAPDEVLAYDAGTPGYACGKLELERLGREAAAGGRKVLVVRPFNVVGEGQSGAYGMVLPTFLAAAAAGAPLRVHGDGSQVRSFCEVGAFTDALLRLVEQPAAWALAGAPINLGSPRPTTILELARLVLAVTGSRSPIEFVPYARDYPGRSDVAFRVPDVSRLEGLIGPTRWPPLEEVVARLARAGRPA